MSRALLVAAKAQAERELLKQTADCLDPANDCVAVEGLACPAFNLAAANFAAAARNLNAHPVAPAGYVEVSEDTAGMQLGVTYSGGEWRVCVTDSFGHESSVQVDQTIGSVLLDTVTP